MDKKSFLKIRQIVDSCVERAFNEINQYKARYENGWEDTIDISIKIRTDEYINIETFKFISDRMKILGMNLKTHTHSGEDECLNISVNTREIGWTTARASLINSIERQLDSVMAIALETGSDPEMKISMAEVDSHVSRFSELEMALIEQYFNTLGWTCVILTEDGMFSSDHSQKMTIKLS